MTNRLRYADEVIQQQRVQIERLAHALHSISMLPQPQYRAAIERANTALDRHEQLEAIKREANG